MRRRAAARWAAAGCAAVACAVGAAGCGGNGSSLRGASRHVNPSGPVPCALTHAAGANGVGSCWARHTGVTGGTGFTEAEILAGHSTLKHIVGDQVITTPGEVLSDVWIDGCIAVKADRVTIRNALIRTRHACSGGRGGTSPSAINDGQGTGSPVGTLVEDTTVDGMDPGNGSSGDSRGVFLGQGSTCLRCNVFGFAKNYWMNGSPTEPSRIVDSYSHDSADDWASSPTAAGCPHENGIYLNSSMYVTVAHSYAIMTGAGYCTTAAISNLADYGPPQHYTVRDSYAEGILGADLYTGKAGACGTPGIVVIGNALSRNNGYSGKDTVNYWTSAGNVWRGNYVPETGAAYAEPSGPQGC